jgi:hypothetical protein
MSSIRRKEKGWLSLFIVGIGLVFSQIAWADDVYTIVIKKQESKQKTRWSLSDWLETRDRMRLQDLWLALHSPSPYEFYVGGNYQSQQVSPGSQTNAWETFFGAYASIFGLEGRYESSFQKRWFGSFLLRVFGFHDQGTNLTLQGGVRSSDAGTFSYRNPFAGATMTLYLSRYFGLEGLYRYYFSSTPDPSGISYSGRRYEGGAFIDFKFVRIYGKYFSDSETAVNWTGFTLGTKVYF